MATAKKSTTKKTTKSSATKARKAPAKAPTTVKRVSAKPAKKLPVSNDALYLLIICAIALLLGLWLIWAANKTNSTYDEIYESQSQQQILRSQKADQ